MIHTEGNLKGRRCPITGQTFLSDNHSKRVQSELLHNQLLWTEAARLKVKERYPNVDPLQLEYYYRLMQEAAK